MNSQEVFDQIVNHLRQQRAKSIDILGRCAYRGSQGKKCAVGVLINDDEYCDQMEGSPVCDLIDSESKSQYVSIELRDRLKPHMELLRALQLTHDLSEIKIWEQQFKEIAEHFKLEYKVLK